MPKDGQHGGGEHSGGSKKVRFPKSPFWYSVEKNQFISDPAGGTHVGAGYRRLPDGCVPGTEGYVEDGKPTPGIQAYLDKGYTLWTPDMGWDA